MSLVIDGEDPVNLFAGSSFAASFQVSDYVRRIPELIVTAQVITHDNSQYTGGNALFVQGSFGVVFGNFRSTAAPEPPPPSPPKEQTPVGEDSYPL